MARRPPQNGLFCWWLPWAGPTGSQQLVDRSNNRNHGTMSGFTASSDWVVDGGYALNFDGTNNYVVSTNGNQFEESVRDRQFSFSGWFKTATAGFGTVFSAGVTATQDPSLFLRADATNNTLLQFFIRNGSGTVNFSITSTSAVNTDKWIHVAAINGGTGTVGARLYINGIEEASQASYSGNTATTWDRFGIGATIRSTIGTYFNGCMDDVRLYNRALTASEVRSLYLCGRGAGFRQSTVTQYNIATVQDISLNTIAATTTVYNPTIAATSSINLNAIAATTTVYNPTIAATANISLNAIAATTTIHNPTIAATNNISLNAIAATTTVYDPTIAATSNISLDAIAATTTVYQPTVGTGDFINLNLIPATTQVYNPTLTAGAVDILLNLIAATTIVRNPIVELITASTDNSDILDRGVKKRRKKKQEELDEENVAAQILKARQGKPQETKPGKKPFEIKIEVEQEEGEEPEIEIEVPEPMTEEQRLEIEQVLVKHQAMLKKNKQLRALLMLATMDEL